MIDIIGLGLGDSANLSPAAQQVIQNCRVIIGSPRQQKMIKPLLIEHSHVSHSNNETNTVLHLDYPRPLSHLSAVLADLLANNTHKNIVLLASGDPLFYGIGRWITQQLKAEQYRFYPNISSIQMAFAAIKQAWQHATIVSLHGRPLISLRPYLRNQCWYGLLTDQHSQPQQIAAELIQQGLGQSKLWVCAALGTAAESIQSFDCHSLTTCSHVFHPLHVTLVYSQGKLDYLPECVGIEDQHFETGRAAGKGMITKKPIRLAALNLLQTQRNDIVWDIGAGCGGMAVEWAYWNLHSTIYAIECHTERLHYLAQNQEKFGVIKNLHIIAGTAPQALEQLAAPNKVFIGGSNGMLGKLLAYTWQRLAIDGCLVVSCVTEECKYEVRQFIQQQQQLDPAVPLQVEHISLAIAHAEPLAGKQVMRPQLPVQLSKISK